MSSLAKFFARRQWLLDRLQQSTGSHERDEIKRLLAKIEQALALLDNCHPGLSIDRLEMVAADEPVIRHVFATSARELASPQSYGPKDKTIVDAADRPRPARKARDRAYAVDPTNTGIDAARRCASQSRI